jgi:hypothetical protein
MCVCMSFQKRCITREKYKLDFDFYTREVKSLREKTALSPAKLERKETKLANAEAVLTAYSTELFHNIRALQQQRDAIMLPQLAQVALPAPSFRVRLCGLCAPWCQRGLCPMQASSCLTLQPRPVRVLHCPAPWSCALLLRPILPPLHPPCTNSSKPCRGHTSQRWGDDYQNCRTSQKQQVRVFLHVAPTKFHVQLPCVGCWALGAGEGGESVCIVNPWAWGVWTLLPSCHGPPCCPHVMAHPAALMSWLTPLPSCHGLLHYPHVTAAVQVLARSSPRLQRRVVGSSSPHPRTPCPGPWPHCRPHWARPLVVPGPAPGLEAVAAAVGRALPQTGQTLATSVSCTRMCPRAVTSWH